MRQPLLHELTTCVRAPTVALSAADGQIGPATGIENAHGVLHADIRVLSEALLTVDGQPPEHLSGGVTGASTAAFVGILRLDDAAVRIVREREVTATGMRERVRLVNQTAEKLEASVALRLATDGAPITEIRAGRRGAPLPVEAYGATLAWRAGATSVLVTAEAGTAWQLRVEPAGLTWAIAVPPGQTGEMGWQLRCTDPSSVVGPAPAEPSWATPQIRADDSRLAAWLARAVDDLDGLRMTAGGDVFVAAGAPWFFTLFGRDSLIAARMMLPLGTELAAGTLRALAARQGRRTDPGSAEEPGKILHELRRGTSTYDSGLSLPPVYYGTVDATCLWVVLLNDAWRWGLAADEVAALLPAAEAALEWMAANAAAGGGFLRYHDTSGHGLANQGWKDSGDAIRFGDGGVAAGPMALCEVQAYAYDAALRGAELLDAFGRPGGDRWRSWAAELAAAFRSRFWVGYPAVALDGRDRPVDTVTSNIGHLLGTGLLDAAESSLVAQRLRGLSSGYGLRTLSTEAVAYSPDTYHRGSVWAHDTAIAIDGLVRSGHHEVAAELVEGLLAAAACFDFRMPELHAGDSRGRWAVPYPTACRPQGWSAAAAVSVLSSIIGLRVHVPAKRVSLEPMRPSPVGAVTAAGLRVAGRTFTASIDASGSPA